MLAGTNPHDGEIPAFLAGGGFFLDRETLRVWFRDNRLDLSLRQFRLLEMFMRAPGQPLSREHILCHVWGPKATSDVDAVDAEIFRLRRAIGADPLRGPIRTIRNVGFIFIPDVRGIDSKVPTSDRSAAMVAANHV